jgi:hypothetical protein
MLILFAKVTGDETENYFPSNAQQISIVVKFYSVENDDASRIIAYIMPPALCLFLASSSEEFHICLCAAHSCGCSAIEIEF